MPWRTRQGEVIRAVEAIKSFCDAVQLDVIQDLADDLMAQTPPMIDPVSWSARKRVHDAQSRDAVARETAMLTGRPVPECQDLVRVATAPGRRCEAGRSRLRDGSTTWARVPIVSRETAHLDPLSADLVADRVLAPSSARVLRSEAVEPHTSGDPTPVSHSAFRQRLNRQLAQCESSCEKARKTRADRLAGRDARAEQLRLGMGAYVIDGSGERILAAARRVDQLARAARAAGDPRPLHQLRSDIGTDLLVHGVVPGHATLGDPPPVRLDILVGIDDLLAATAAEVVRMASERAGQEPDASLYAPRPAGCGITDAGALPVEVCRELLLAPGSVVRRPVTDPTTRTVLDSASTYRVPASMGAFVRARDRHRRAPGCETTHAQSDLDHDTNWRQGAAAPAHGATHPDNLRVLDRPHHNLKTRGYWSSTQHLDGAITWKTLTTTVRTLPFDPYDAQLTAPVLESSAKEVAAMLEDQAGTDLLEPEAAALAIAVLGGPVPVTPTPQFLAAQEAADAAEAELLFALNAGG